MNSPESSLLKETRVLFPFPGGPPGSPQVARQVVSHGERSWQMSVFFPMALAGWGLRVSIRRTHALGCSLVVREAEAGLERQCRVGAVGPAPVLTPPSPPRTVSTVPYPDLCICHPPLLPALLTRHLNWPFPSLVPQPSHPHCSKGPCPPAGCSCQVLRVPPGRSLRSHTQLLADPQARPLSLCPLTQPPRSLSPCRTPLRALGPALHGSEAESLRGLCVLSGGGLHVCSVAWSTCCGSLRM